MKPGRPARLILVPDGRRCLISVPVISKVEVQVHCYWLVHKYDRIRDLPRRSRSVERGIACGQGRVESLTCLVALMMVMWMTIMFEFRTCPTSFLCLAVVRRAHANTQMP
ncbi:hypothetical protein BU24DRAFT_139077 [Aaosphaeria arxii CBS 175.79]|uniref:Uncharacterized protein n=1 Tax=Aaosphaeria arxii CBS 175.79 TaxID=1450172 RepID=A0A6A5XV52_9PLEO|nr:uncharacterized protein BU24DRAFT_139077 [Aaosphaeria arxii CBS 175.79]KAF2016829.1 hypothetical protein BU24DRAFT_139077 [Aaosphaeria arxii CBS 175.79]